MADSLKERLKGTLPEVSAERRSQFDAEAAAREAKQALDDAKRKSTEANLEWNRADANARIQLEKGESSEAFVAAKARRDKAKAAKAAAESALKDAQEAADRAESEVASAKETAVGAEAEAGKTAAAESKKQQEITQLEADIRQKKALGDDVSAEEARLRALKPAAPAVDTSMNASSYYAHTAANVAQAAAKVGKSPWQQSLNVPAPTITAPAGMAAGDAVFMGFTQGEREEQHGMAPATREPLVPGQNFIDKQTAYLMYASLPQDQQQKMYSLMDKYYGKGKWDARYIANFWQEAVNVAAAKGAQNQWATPLDAMNEFVDSALKYGNAPSSPVTTTTVNLTDPTTARGLLDQALSAYLGRTATTKEQQAFLKALNVQERENPSVTTTGSGFSTTKGGFSPQQFAVEYARGQEGAGEYAAATTYLDTFLNSIANPINVAGA